MEFKLVGNIRREDYIIDELFAKKTTKLEGANLGKISSQKIRELGFPRYSSLSLRGGNISQIFFL